MHLRGDGPPSQKDGSQDDGIVEECDRALVVFWGGKQQGGKRGWGQTGTSLEYFTKMTQELNIPYESSLFCVCGEKDSVNEYNL